MKQLFITLLLFTLLIGCKKEESHSKIEIYLLKNPVASTEGIPMLQVEKFSNMHDEIRKGGLDSIRYDTVNDLMIYAGKFVAVRSDLEDKPFINDDEIQRFYSNKHILLLDSLAAKRIEKLKPNMRKGLQFVVAVNNHPVLFGYFRNIFSSQHFHTYQIQNKIGYFGIDKLPDIKSSANKKLFYIGFGEYMPNQVKLKRPPYNPELIDAFRKSGRLIE